MTASVICAVALALAVWFGATLATAIRLGGEDGVLPVLVVAGYVMMAAIGVVVMSVLGGITYAMSAHQAPRALAVGPYTALTIAGTVAGAASALPLGASALGIACTHILPVWTAWLAAAAAAARLLAAFATNGTGELVPGGALVNYVPAVLVGVWVLSVSALLIREHLPVTIANTGAVRHA